ncbi:MAG: hypothetical protein P8M78_05995 [Myxococcota bacterium]|nr:hypothetical protein [Myxococcota bacterium]
MAARSPDQNLDSLLDTMSNVVGILVVLVAVTQLSISDAVERITGERSALEPVSAEALALGAQQAEDIEAAIVAAQGELEVYQASAARAGVLAEELRPHVETLENLAGRLDTSDLISERIVQQTLRHRGERDRLSSEISDRRRRVQGLEALMGSVPEETRPKVARLPNPRTPPVGATESAVLCRYGRCALLDLAGMRGMLRLGIENALGTGGGFTYEDRPWLLNWFSKKTMGSGNYYWAFREDDRAFFADIKWEDIGYGESSPELSKKDSAFVRGLSELGRDGRFLRFYAWSDSFEAYLEARYLAEQLGWDVSWLAIDEAEEVGINLVGRSKRRILLD